MSTRQNIIDYFQDVQTKDDTDLLMLVHAVCGEDKEKVRNFYTWMVSALRSINYKPNRQALTVVSSGNFIGATSLAMSIMPPFEELEIVGDIKDLENLCHQKFSLCLSDLSYYSHVKQIGTLCASDMFTVINPFTSDITTDKRLSSYIAICENWVFPKRKDFVIVDLNDVDLELLSQTNIDAVWGNLFYNYKTKPHGQQVS